MSEWYVLDEREGGIAVLLDSTGAPCRVPVDQVPVDAPDGMVLRWNAAAHCYRPDPEAAARRQAAMREKVRRLLG